MKYFSVTRIKVLTILPLLQAIPTALFFIAAGSVDFPFVWLLLALSLLNSLVMSLLMNDELLKERLSKKPDIKKWDPAFHRIYPAVGLLLYLAAGLDAGRFSITPPIAWEIKAVLLAALGLAMLFADWAVLMNKFFSRYVRVQTDRGHHVIDKGPYRFLRHPAYFSSLLMLLAAPLLLNSVLAYVPAALAAGLVVWRTSREDAALKQELPGYVEYARRVRYRLLPGVY